MRIIHVVPGLSEEASGPSYSVVRLCEALIAEHQDVKLAALDWGPLTRPLPFLEAFPRGVGPSRLGRSPAMFRWLRRQCEAAHADVLHNHGMWQMNAVYPAWAKRCGRIQLVYSPRGAFSEWAMGHGSRMKKIFWPLLQHPALKRATCFHATSGSEYADIRRLGFRQPVAVLPNGIDLPVRSTKPKSDRRTMLFLGRIHPTKGLDLLLHAWRQVQDEFDDWGLAIAGPDGGWTRTGGYLKQVQSLAAELGAKRVEFAGPLYGADKASAYRNADLFVLPTHSENFGMTVAEALASGTPAIVSRGAPWAGLEVHRAGWWVEIGVEPLATAFRQALSQSPEELSAMGERGRSWMQEEFSWASIGSRMAATYRWLVDRSLPTPNWIETD